MEKKGGKNKKNHEKVIFLQLNSKSYISNVSSLLKKKICS